MAPSTQQQGVSALTQTTWEGLTEPGAYIEEGTGDLFRIPAEALITGASPVIGRVSKSSGRLFQVSKNPNVILMKARMVAADHDIQPNF